MSLVLDQTAQLMTQPDTSTQIERLGSTSVSNGGFVALPHTGVGLLPLDLTLLGTLVFAALTYGATEPWSQQVVGAMAGLMAAYAAFWLWIKKQTISFRWPLVVSVTGFAVFVVIQTIPLPQGLVAWIASGVHATRTTSLAGLPPSTDWVTLSLIPTATVRQLWTLLPVITVFAVVSQCYRGEFGVRRVCVILSVAGATAIAVSIKQNIEDLGEAGKAFGGAVHEHAYSGPFLHHGPFSQFVALSFGAALAVTFDALFHNRRSAVKPWQRFTLILQASSGLLVMSAGLLMIWLSGARMGIVSLMLSIAAVGGLTWILTWRCGRGSGRLRPRRRVIGYSVILVVLGSGSAALVFLLLDLNVGRPLERWSLFMQPMRVVGDRFEVLNSLWPAVLDRPVFGAGFGSFEYVFASYDRPAAPRPMLVRYANNEYAHLLFETGLIGLMFIALWLSVIFGTACGLIAHGPVSLKPLARGLSVGLVAIVLYSCADFGQHVPAVALMTATAAGGVMGLTTHCTGTSRLIPGFRSSIVLRGSLVVVFFLLLGVGAAAAAIQLEKPKQARKAFAIGQAIEKKIYFPKLQSEMPAEADWEMIRWYDRAAKLDPAVPGYAYRRDYFTWGMMVANDRGDRTLSDAVNIDRDEAFRLMQSVNQTRRSAPTFGPAVALASDIAGTGLREYKYAQMLSTLARELGPNDPSIALIHARNLGRSSAGRHELMAELDRLIRLAPYFHGKAMFLCVQELADYETARYLAGNNTLRLQVLRQQLIHCGAESAEINLVDQALDKQRPRGLADDPS